MADTWRAIVNSPTVRIMTLLVINTMLYVNYNPETGIGKTWLMFHRYARSGNGIKKLKLKKNCIILLPRFIKLWYRTVSKWRSKKQYQTNSFDQSQHEQTMSQSEFLAITCKYVYGGNT